MQLAVDATEQWVNRAVDEQGSKKSKLKTDYPVKTVCFVI